MKAANYSKTKSGKVLELKNLEQPVPKDNEVVLRVRAASVNPLDWRMKEKRPGVDVAGEIVAVGRAVTQFKPGDSRIRRCQRRLCRIRLCLRRQIGSQAGKRKL